MNCAIQDFLRSGGTVEQLAQEPYFVSAKAHKKYPNLLLFKYDQIFSDFSNPVVCSARGIILDSSDNWRIVSNPFPKFFNYGEPNAAKIDWDSARALEKLDGCFSYNAALQLWDGGTVKIGDVVNKKLKVKLIGMDEEGNLVPCYPTNWFKNGSKKHWVRFTSESSGKRGHSKLLCTPNHELFINGKFQPADTAQVGDDLTKFVSAPNQAAEHFIKSSLLGDGSISPSAGGAKFSTGHAQRYKYLNKFAQDSLGSFGVEPRTITSGFGTKMTQVSSLDTRWLLDLRQEWYPENKKIVPQNLDWMDDLSVAIWYMDDGSLSHNEGQQDRALFATNGFSESDVRRLGSRLERMYGVQTTTYFSKGWCLRVNSGRNGEIHSFWCAVAPHVTEDTKYKLPEKYRKTQQALVPIGEKIYAKFNSKILSVESVEPTKRNFQAGTIGYDIETTTHNYFCQGHLVHNSLVQVYHYNNKWHVATSGSPDASGPVGAMSDKTFEDLIWETWDKESYDTSVLLPELTYLFELMTPYNRVVVRHDEAKLVLIGIRHTETGGELSPSISMDHKSVKEFPLRSIQEINDAFKNISGLEQEGFVVVDKNFNRVKIKHPDYVLAHQMVGSLTPKKVLDAVRRGEMDEVINYFPEWKDVFTKVKSRLDDLTNQYMVEYNRICAEMADLIKNSPVVLNETRIKKEFALKAQDTGLSTAPFFAMMHKRVSCAQHFADTNLDHLAAVLKIDNLKD